MSIQGQSSFVIFNKKRGGLPQSMRDYETVQRRIKMNGETKIDYVSSFIDKFFGTHVTITILLSLANIVVSQNHIKLDRLARRNRSALLCWYAENWNVIDPILRDKNFIAMFSQNSQKGIQKTEKSI